MGLIDSLSTAFNAREDGLRLIIAILAGYPLAVIHRTFLFKAPRNVQHVFFVLTGLMLYWFNYGFATVHSIIATINAYIITNYFAGTTLSVILAHLAFLGHLLFGYWMVETDQYDITWTTPFCIMTLRFTGLVMDVYDGKKSKDKIKGSQSKTAISDPPDLLEIAAFGFIFCGTFVGHLFPFSKFRSFVNGEFLNEKGEVRTSSLMPSLGRFLGGCLYAVIHLWGNYWIPCDYFNSYEFLNLPFFWKLVWTVLWFRLIMSRYIFCWLINEGAAILSGIAYNGKDEYGEDRWDGTRDINILKWEFGLDFQSAIESFNLGTNAFAKNHIFKRLQWMGNKVYSHALTLVYLAIWHGYHLGYFLLFWLEFACVMAQRQLYDLVDKIPSLRNLIAQSWMRPVKFILGRLIINISMSIGFFSFGLVKTRLWIRPLSSMYFLPHIFYSFIWPLFYFLVNKMMKQKVEHKKTE
ncbi:unnamed protein product [Dracunculus medinensis]|uniref:Lysophospholipid acyltransferase 5 n=1 Tax=Dracunculus medinensis TaxID=318479 RepID=A0A0N4U2S7_DRAME|nr:unnamed protein product [Dracunculus medinensis]